MQASICQALWIVKHNLLAHNFWNTWIALRVNILYLSVLLVIFIIQKKERSLQHIFNFCEVL